MSKSPQVLTGFDEIGFSQSYNHEGNMGVISFILKNISSISIRLSWENDVASNTSNWQAKVFEDSSLRGC